MSDRELLREAAFELRNYEFTELAAAVERAADLQFAFVASAQEVKAEVLAGTTDVRVPRDVAKNLYVVAGVLKDEYPGLQAPVEALGRALFDA